MHSTLSELCARGQAVAVIEGVLYFASLPERPPPVSVSAQRHQTPRTAQATSNGLHSLDNTSGSVVGGSDDVGGEEAAHTTASPLTPAWDPTLPAPPQTRRVCIRDLKGASAVVVQPREDGETQDAQNRLRATSIQSALLSPPPSSPLPAVAHTLFTELLHDGGSGGGCLVGRDAFYFSIAEDSEFVYRSFCADFGPLDLGCTLRFARRLARVLRASAGYQWAKSGGSNGAGGEADGGGELLVPASGWRETVPVVFCTGLAAAERANGMCLMAAFCVLALGWGPEEVQRVLLHPSRCYPPLLPFRDISHGPSSYPLSVANVARGLHKALRCGWVGSLRGCQLDDLEAAKTLGYSWLIPGKVLALRSPDDQERGREAAVYARALQRLGVTLLVRLNEKLYAPQPLLLRGIRVVEMEFPDGTAPTDAVLTRFLSAVEAEFDERMHITRVDECGNASAAQQRLARGRGAHGNHSSVGGVSRSLPPASTQPSRAEQLQSKSHSSTGVVAVHCRAGLGRTGTLIAVYLMRHYRFTAAEAIGWLRLCRPGSVSGAQQQYLDTIERRLLPAARAWTDARLAALQNDGARGSSGGAATMTEGQLIYRSHATEGSAGVAAATTSQPPQGSGASVRPPPKVQKRASDGDSRPHTAPCATEQRYELAEAEALLLCDPHFTTQRAIAERFKYASSSVVAVEQQCPLNTAVELQKDFSSRRRFPRRSSAVPPHPQRACDSRADVLALASRPQTSSGGAAAPLDNGSGRPLSASNRGNGHVYPTVAPRAATAATLRPSATKPSTATVQRPTASVSRRSTRLASRYQAAKVRSEHVAAAVRVNGPHGSANTSVLCLSLAGDFDSRSDAWTTTTQAGGCVNTARMGGSQSAITACSTTGQRSRLPPVERAAAAVAAAPSRLHSPGWGAPLVRLSGK